MKTPIRARHTLPLLYSGAGWRPRAQRSLLNFRHSLLLLGEGYALGGHRLLVRKKALISGSRKALRHSGRLAIAECQASPLRSYRQLAPNQ